MNGYKELYKMKSYKELFKTKSTHHDPFWRIAATFLIWIGIIVLLFAA